MTPPEDTKLEAATREDIDLKLKAAGWTVQDKKSFNLFESLGVAVREMDTVTSPADYVLFIDECHRSIFNLWRQVLEYFDAFLMGLTVTPSKQILGFFNQNLVMKYSPSRR